MRPITHTEIKLLNFRGSAENSITRNTSKKIGKALKPSGKAFMILSTLKKAKKQYS